MLIKEYRIPLPMTVEEYRIAQLYMIAKKSREESKGAESGVEILVNEPYTEGPGGSGQFTHKVYHVGSHLPGWFKSLLPKSALTVEEEAWNAYPYTKTRFKCPFVEKFSLEIETFYTPDGGHQDNVFNLSEGEKRNRIVDLIDVVKDQDGSAYEDPLREDPTFYVSEKTGRGPLNENWIDDYWNDVKKSSTQPTPSGKSIMCAYKLCKVEFRYWGMQSKIERFIHDVALRKTMLKAHLQAWVWQDEWVGLTMEDIRAIERETAELLKKRFHGDDEVVEALESDLNKNNAKDKTPTPSRIPSEENSTTKATFSSIEYAEKDVPEIIPKGSDNLPRKSICIEEPSAPALAGASAVMASAGLNRSRSINTSYMSSSHSKTERSALDTAAACASDNDEDDEFFDCRENLDDASSLAKWSSMELIPADGDETTEPSGSSQLTVMHSLGPGTTLPNHHQHVTFRRVHSMREPAYIHSQGPDQHPFAGTTRLSRPVIDIADHGDTCPTTILILVAHGGSVLDLDMEVSMRKSDVTTFRGALESVMRTHYPSLVGHVAVRCIPCPAICTESIALLSNLSPYSYTMSLGTFVNEANVVFNEFLASEEGQGFNGQVVLVADSVGAILSYDALCPPSDSTVNSKRTSSDGSINSGKPDIVTPNTSNSENNDSSNSSTKRLSTSINAQSKGRHLSHEIELDLETRSRFDFDVSDFFIFGSSLGLVLAYRKMHQAGSDTGRKSHLAYCNIPRPSVQQVYNLFHPSDPLACRIEPLLSAKFSRVPPVNVPRYQKYPMGDGVSLSLIEFIQSNSALFAASEGNSRPTTPGRHVSACSGSANTSRRVSEESILSGLVDDQQLHTIQILRPKWWGPRRLDFALYCPDGLTNFPTNALPHLFHSSYWESADVISFLLRQVVRPEHLKPGDLGSPELNIFTPNQPREKWIKKRTSVKIRNGAANHRANDVIVKEGNPQTLVARFSYGPLDMAALTGERVDIHLMKEPPAGDWIHLSTEVTDKHGRVTHTMKHPVGYGIYPVRMLVRGDHTMLHMYLAVVPPRTESVVFSIDGSFAASVSVTGRDPKVKAGAVDIVRHWQELGYLIIYVTGRPDMQLQRVVSWLAQHNFPHGLVSFADGFTTDPLRHKSEYLKQLKVEQEIIIHCAYGSSKDISVYAGLGLRPDQIYIVGKINRKHQSQATFLTEGYSDHLAKLTTHGGSRPAQGNARMVIPKTNFCLPGQNVGLVRRRTLRSTAKRTTSYPLHTGGEGC